MTPVTTEDDEILSMLAGDDGWAEIGADSSCVTFGQDVGDEFGARRGQRRRMRRRGVSSVRELRKKRRKAIARVAKKVANNKIVRAIGKAALSVVPGGQAVVAATTAVRIAKKLASAARRGSKTAQAGVALARAARGGNRAALQTLRSAASGNHSFLPVQASMLRAAGYAVPRARSSAMRMRGFGRSPWAFGESTSEWTVRAPNGETFTFGAGEL